MALPTDTLATPPPRTARPPDAGPPPVAAPSPEDLAAQPVFDSALHARSGLGAARDVIRYRDLLGQLISRNIKTRYKRTALGAAWTMLNPLLTMGVMAVVFSHLFHARITHYPVYILAGLTAWNFFAQTTTSIMSELVWGNSLTSRIYVPRVVFALAAVGTGLVNLAVALVPLALIMLTVGAPVTPALLLLPLAMALLALFALGVGPLLSLLAVQFTDVVDMYAILLTAWMYLTPLFYSPEIIDPRYQALFGLNPMVHLVAAFRLPLQEGRLPESATLATAVIVAVGTFLVGWWAFARQAEEVAARA